MVYLYLLLALALWSIFILMMKAMGKQKEHSELYSLGCLIALAAAAQFTSVFVAHRFHKNSDLVFLICIIVPIAYMVASIVVQIILRARKQRHSDGSS
jgi:drug/metabolite transporter (DMT)-like permease